MICIMCPINAVFGGGAAKKDLLSYIGMSNLVFQSPLYLVHACIVWVVVIITMNMLMNAQWHFVELRKDWLLRMPHPRSTTLLVEGIPDQYCSDHALSEFMNTCFPDMIERVYMVKKTKQLSSLVREVQSCEDWIAELKYREQREKDGYISELMR